MQENRVTETFGALAKKGERALVCYVVAGYPDVKTTVEIVDALVAGGADIIELGIPFSDPIADGPTIQQASHKALEGGITPEKALGTAQTVRKRHPRLPLFVMTYSNILIRAGMDNFIARAKGCGIDGFILPDLPVEEADDYLTAAQRHEMSTVFLASPNTSDDRLGKIAASSSGFMYLVSIYGITGVRKTFEDYTETAIKRAKQAAGAGIPVGVGFGISTPAHAKFMFEAGADAIIVGSAIVDRISKAKSKRAMTADLKSFASSMKRACK